MRELRYKCPSCGDSHSMDLIVDIPTVFTVEENGKVNFSINNNPMIDKIDDLLDNFNKYNVRGHCRTCGVESACLLTKDKRIIFVENKGVKK